MEKKEPKYTQEKEGTQIYSGIQGTDGGAI